jgi:hypothetical protein
MKQHHRALIALFILLSGLSLIPQIGLFAGAFSWEQFAGLYQDSIFVRRARYRNGELEVRATCSCGGNSTLQVFVLSTNEYMGALAWEEDENEYRGDLPWPTNPQQIRVQSHAGASFVGVTFGLEVPPVVSPPSTAPSTLYLPILTR